MKTMRIIHVEAGKEADVLSTDRSLEILQALVGGHLEMLCPFNDTAVIVCNDEGKIKGLPLNRGITHPETGELYEIIAGNFFICDAPSDSDDFESLSEDQVKVYLEKFKYPEKFMRINEKIIAIKY